MRVFCAMRADGFTLSVLLCAALAARPLAADGVVAAGVAVDEHGVRDFHLSVRHHFGVDEATFVKVRGRKIPDEHLPVVFLIAREAKVSPDAVVELRLGGTSWCDVALRFGLSPTIFHVHSVQAHGPPYGRALGHFKNRPQAEWAAIRLGDDDAVCLANLKFLAAHHGLGADEVIRLHAHEGDKGFAGFVALHGKVKAHRGAEKGKEKEKEPPKKDAGAAARAHEKPQDAAEKGHGSSAKGGGKGAKAGGGKGKKR
jgi:hypothetical protein